MELTNSKRIAYTASYVSTQLTAAEQREVESKPGDAYGKGNTLRSLDLKPLELERLRAAMNADPTTRDREDLEKLFTIAQRLAVTQRPMSMMELATAIAPISHEALSHFVTLSSTVKDLTAGVKVLLFWSKRRRKISPIGRIHLERIEMYPAGVQKGELVFTVPMAGGETVSISHKEWSTSSREYEEIVQDYFESYSERGVAEKNDTSMSMENESKHASAVNFGASLSGSYAGVTLTTTLGITKTNDERESVKRSMQKNREVTEKASARVRKEHKVSVKLVTKTGTENISAKTITNTATTPIRIDYYRMMRKWRSDLFRYGLRQTYDIAIPLPGVRLWALHQHVVELDKQIRKPFVFPFQAEQITHDNWAAKAIEVGVSTAVVPLPPARKIYNNITPPEIGYFSDADSENDRFGKIDFVVPAGYRLEAAQSVALLSAASGGPRFTWYNGGSVYNAPAFTVTGDLAHYIDPNKPRTGALAATFSYSRVHTASLTLHLEYALTDAATYAWKRDAWAAMKASAEALHGEKLGRLQEERDRLWRLLNGKDTLSLRRLEREELVRLVMQWLMGPAHPVIVDVQDPSIVPVQTTTKQLLVNEQDFQSHKSNVDAPTFAGMSTDAWRDALEFGESVKFIHQAIEWENLLYFLYPYFWGSETIGREKMLFEHADPEHERFLRAGFARIVLPVRPGFEEDFTQLLETGALPASPTAPYLTVAQDIANFAKTNYAGIPPANPELHARPLLYPEQRATWDTMQDAMKAIDTYEATNSKYPAKLDDLPSGLPVDAWGNALIYRLPGLGADYDLLSLGADGIEGGEGLNADISSAAGASLVATWFDYTPTSALDIEVDTKPADIA